MPIEVPDSSRKSVGERLVQHADRLDDYEQAQARAETANARLRAENEHLFEHSKQLSEDAEASGEVMRSQELKLVALQQKIDDQLLRHERSEAAWGQALNSKEQKLASLQAERDDFKHQTVVEAEEYAELCLLNEALRAKQEVSKLALAKQEKRHEAAVAEWARASDESARWDEEQQAAQQELQEQLEVARAQLRDQVELEDGLESSITKLEESAAAMAELDRQLALSKSEETQRTEAQRARENHLQAEAEQLQAELGRSTTQLEEATSRISDLASLEDQLEQSCDLIIELEAKCAQREEQLAAHEQATQLLDQSELTEDGSDDTQAHQGVDVVRFEY